MAVGHRSTVRAFGLAAVAGGMVLLVACGGGGAPAAAAPTSGAAPTSAAAGTTETGAAATTEAPVAPSGPARPLAAVFPDVDRAECQPATGPTALTSSTGAQAVEGYDCDYGSTVPGARVNFAQWADTAAARTWYQDTVDLGPRVEQYRTWSVQGQEQGDLWTAVNSSGQVISTGIYSTAPYTWEIRAASLDEINRIGPALTLLPSNAIGG